MNSFRRVAFLLISALLAIILAFPSSAQTGSFKPKTQNGYIYGIPEKTDFSKLSAALPSMIISVTRTDGTPIKQTSTDFIGTGCKISINGSVFTAVVLGDVDGNGLINSSDYLLVKKHIIGSLKLQNIQLLAAGDDNGDGKLSPVNYLKIKRHALGTYDLNKEFAVDLPETSDNESGWTNSWV